MLRELVLAHLDVSEEDFDDDVPFTSYGLDSLSAGRLSSALRSHLRITQMQLLADLSMHDLIKRAAITNTPPPPSNAPAPVRKPFTWAALNQFGETVIRLVDGEGIPLFMVHPSSGNIVALMPLQEHFDTPLYALQMTPETPTDSLHSWASFYFGAIKATQPQGPYRLAGYSGTSLLAMMLARIFLAAGDDVVQLAFLDHFPMVFASPTWTMDLATYVDRIPSRASIGTILESIFDLYRRDSTPRGVAMIKGLTAAFEGHPTSDFTEAYYRNVERTIATAVDFLLNNFIPTDHGRYSDDDTTAYPGLICDGLESWIGEVSRKTPMVLYLASRGIRSTLRDFGEDWEDLGGLKAGVKVVHLHCGHFEMSSDQVVTEGLQREWRKTSVP